MYLSLSLQGVITCVSVTVTVGCNNMCICHCQAGSICVMLVVVITVMLAQCYFNSAACAPTSSGSFACFHGSVVLVIELVQQLQLVVLLSLIHRPTDTSTVEHLE